MLTAREGVTETPPYQKTQTCDRHGMDMNVFSLDIEESIRVWIQFVKLKENRGGDGQMLKLGDRRRRPARHEDKEERWNC